MKNSAKLKMKVIKAWGGFLDGKLHVREIDTGFGGYQTTGFIETHAIFRTRTEARKQYEDVRRVSLLFEEGYRP
jgi:hypothetical protein